MIKDYDIIILGSSPPLLVLALRLARVGKRVLVLEKEDYLGGSWKIIDIDEFKNVDAHCHIFVQDFRSFKKMRTELNWDLIKVEPQPIFIYKDWHLHYNNPLRYLVAIIEPFFYKKKYHSNASVWDVKNTQLSEVLEFFKILWQTILTVFIRRISYPKGGCYEILEKLREDLTSENVVLMKNQGGIDIEITENSNVLITKNNKFSFEKIYISTGSEFNEIVKDGTRWTPTFEYKKSYHFYMVIQDQELFSSLSYIYFGMHKKIARIYEPPNSRELYKSNQKRLIILQLRNKYAEEYDHSQLCDELLQELKDLNLIGTKSKLLNSHFDYYRSSRLKQEDLDSLKECYSREIGYMHVTNIARGINEAYRLKI